MGTTKNSRKTLSSESGLMVFFSDWLLVGIYNLQLLTKVIIFLHIPAQS